MRNLRESKPIWHAMAWIALYVVAVNVGDNVSLKLPQAISATGILLVALSIALLVYLKRDDLAGRYGLTGPRAGTMPATLYLAPLFLIAFLQYAKGIKPELDASAVIAAVVLVAGVGFIEEVLFRGFLFQALRVKGGVNRAILISGATFGIGHIVNLARGYTGFEQSIQVIAAVVIGIALAYCVALTGSIIPGVVFHALFNLSGTLTNQDAVRDMYIVGAIIVVSVPYTLFMRARLARATAQAATVTLNVDAAYADGAA